MKNNDILNWLKASAIRAVKTGAQTALALIGTAVIFQQVDWLMVGSGLALAMIMSVLTSIAGIPEVGDGAPLYKLSIEKGEK